MFTRFKEEYRKFVTALDLLREALDLNTQVIVDLQSSIDGQVQPMKQTAEAVSYLKRAEQHRRRIAGISEDFNG